MNMHPDPNLDDPREAIVHRVITALRAEFSDDEQVPRFVVVAELPPDGAIEIIARGGIGIASSGDDAIDTHRMLTLAAASVRGGMTEATRVKARELWSLLAAGFERRQ